MADANSKTTSSTELVAQAVFRAEVLAAQRRVDETLTRMSTSIDTLARDQGELRRMLAEGSNRFMQLDNEDAKLHSRIDLLDEAHKAAASTKNSIKMMLIDKLIGTVLPWAAIGALFLGKH